MAAAVNPSQQPGSAAGILPPAPLPPGYERWLYTAEELATSPSMADGMSASEEAAAHRDSLDFIALFASVFNSMDAAKTRDVIGSAFLIYHRFFIRRSIKAFDRLEIATACVMLGAKITNRPQLARTFVARLLERKDRRLSAVDEHSETYVLAKEALVGAERALLTALEFDFASVVLPFEHIRYACRLLGLQEEHERMAVKAAMTMLRTQHVALQYDPATLAHTSILMAAKLRKTALPAAALIPQPVTTSANAAPQAADAPSGDFAGTASISSSGDSSSASLQQLQQPILYTPLSVMQHIMGTINAQSVRPAGPAVAAAPSSAVAAAAVAAGGHFSGSAAPSLSSSSMPPPLPPQPPPPPAASSSSAAAQ